MKHNRIVSLVSLIFSAWLIQPVFSQQQSVNENITITTYYPAPFGVYQSLQLYPTYSETIPLPACATSAPPTCDTSTEGTMYYECDTYQLKLCQQRPAGTRNWLSVGHWTLNGTNLYPNDNSWNVGIGTTTPAAKLDVAGGAKIADDTADCTGTNLGTMRYHNGLIQYCDNNTWKVVGPRTVSGSFTTQCNTPNCQNYVTKPRIQTTFKPTIAYCAPFAFSQFTSANCGNLAARCSVNNLGPDYVEFRVQIDQCDVYGNGSIIPFTFNYFILGGDS